MVNMLVSFFKLPYIYTAYCHIASLEILTANNFELCSASLEMKMNNSVASKSCEQRIKLEANCTKNCKFNTEHKSKIIQAFTINVDFT